MRSYGRAARAFSASYLSAARAFSASYLSGRPGFPGPRHFREVDCEVRRSGERGEVCGELRVKGERKDLEGRLSIGVSTVTR